MWVGVGRGGELGGIGRDARAVAELVTATMGPMMAVGLVVLALVMVGGSRRWRWPRLPPHHHHHTPIDLPAFERVHDGQLDLYLEGDEEHGAWGRRSSGGAP